ncbi:MAG TPA: 4-(cytidine 5'-diphospho)-2-C-methyl-D-erythritol kinase [Gemmataceae bacterium]|nr:4-(cytidine 5'-diphospho)-2-C-methyl-D-erythritol kinase [Gemmataceae bacterium]
MLSERRDGVLVVRAPAKVNLFLEVLAKRPDGYHEVATLMVAVSLYDTLAFKEDPSGAIRLRCDAAELSTGPDNLVCKAAALLRQRSGCTRGADVRLSKRIPMAAGLAGGSTDCAAALQGLNRLWRLGLARDELVRLGGELGSDVPFFFHTPAAWCTGRGEVVAPVALGRPLDFVIAKPAVGLSTAEVYRGVTVPDRPETGEEVRRALAAGDVEEIGRRLHNRLQEAAERLRPEIATGLERLRAQGPAGQMMSGSGTSLFALCRDSGEAQRIARELQPLRVYVVRSCS